MKTITGNTVRLSLSSYGRKVNSHAEACQALDFTVSKEPIARAKDQKIIGGNVGLFHSKTGECLGIHSDGFSFLQPCESLETLEKARQLVGGEWQSAASCKGGRMICGFISLERKITAPRRGDQVALSVGFFDHFDGKGRSRLQLVANVLACDNGMTRANEIVSFNEKHSPNIKARFAALQYNLFVELQKQADEMQGVVNKLDNADFSVSEMEIFAERLLPSNGDEVSTRTENRRAEIVAGFSRGTGNRGATRWDAFNAVTEFIDWQSTFRETEFSREENRFESILAGSGARMRARALEMLMN